MVSNMNKAIFLDRDGTLIEEKNYLSNTKDIFLLDGVVEGLKKLQKEYKLIIVTNQSGVARGYFNEERIKGINLFIENLFMQYGINISKTYYCPHYKNGVIKEYSIDCNCRKPKTGLIDTAVKDFNIDLKKSYVIGDKKSDMELAENCGCKKIFIKNQNYEEPNDVNIFKANNILDAANYILK